MVVDGKEVTVKEVFAVGVANAVNPGVPAQNVVGPCSQNDGQNDF